MSSLISESPNKSHLKSTSTNTSTGKSSKKREVYRYQTDWIVSSIAWSNEPSDLFNLALCSYIEEYRNKIRLVRLKQDSYDEEIETTATFEHPYPATKVLWSPAQTSPHLLATTADYLRLWRVDNHTSTRDTTVKLECLLSANQSLKSCSPLTSFDWSHIERNTIVTSSVDTTCAVWDIEAIKLVGSTQTSKISYNLRSQILAHNHEVYDVSFSGRDCFVSAAGDGSIRLFDLRKLSTSTVLLEIEGKAFVRVACNKQDPNYIAAFASESSDILLLDVRNPGKPIAELNNHTDKVNSISWAPHSAQHLCSAGDDNQALIWGLAKLPSDPLLAYNAKGKINAISWSASHPDWIAIGFQNYLELLRV